MKRAPKLLLLLALALVLPLPLPLIPPSSFARSTVLFFVVLGDASTSGVTEVKSSATASRSTSLRSIVHLLSEGHEEAGGPGSAPKANLIVEFFSDYPLKNIIDGNLVFPRPPDEIINKRAYPASDLPSGRGLSR